MKKRVLLYFTMVVLMAIPQQIMADDIAINETNFPDEIFRNWVLAQDYGQDGVLTEEEIAAVTGIYVYSKGIINLKGIEYFTALTRLDCYTNQLTSLDVSKNTELRLLLCYGNQLTSLDVSKNTALTILRCYDNQLTSLDVSKNTALRQLTCKVNHLTSLDVSKNTALTYLDCYHNQLASLDVSNNTTLTELYCSYNQLSELDVSNNTALKTLSCHSNQLASLDVSKNTALMVLECNNNQMTSLDVSNNTALTELWCSLNQINGTAMDALIEGLSSTGGRFYAIEPKNYYEQNVVTKVQVAAAKEKGWTTYYYHNKWEEYEGSDPAAEGIAIDATNFPDENFRNWVLAQDYGQDGVLTEEEIAGVTEISVSYQNITNLKGIEYFTALKGLYCYGNQLTALDVSKNTALTELSCGINQLTSLDVSKNTALDYFGCSYNQLTSLDLSKNSVLTEIDCGSNQLVSLDVTQNTALTELTCFYNQLTSLDVSKNTALKGLYCFGNQLTALDVSKNTALTELSCGGNQLTSLDVSKDMALTTLYCYENQLTSLDVSQNSALTELYCYGNQIKGAAMDALIAGLPSTGGNFNAIIPDDSNEQNVVTKAQVAAAKEKHWTTYYYRYGDWFEYEGSDPEIAPVDQGETIDIGTELDENTNLDGNVVGDVYYCISSGDGSYDPEEGCIVVTKPTDDSAIDGKDIFGEDFKDGYTGVVFKVAPGKGTINVEAETTGNMVLKVKVGDNAPAQMEVNGKTKVSFSYDVSEPTMVFIYGSSKSAGAKGMRKATGTDALKIYGFEVVSGTDGIEEMKDERLKMKDSPVYNLSGQRVSNPGKGVFIKNGKKVLVK